uniref:WW domain-containing protein n=1 Tax=Lotharella oceanica TaxID=641309 RepID=A0A7S2TK53_9EUKA|mmetsp:Transcript_16368/g.31041  ORF Transcript_16368/g.31041 Transcript_16368/m.31041 type:complete len:380 (+) Transcript_16368:107-1246(+)|eukprot:CAMPEP_0170168096 /NCGR_PEP_ID=MMETSP0040_2-20121228/1275_1 /TAXON_ID=641309 /ORGANISM="Lotharella oceanica, Strain CCMP622" /LENGTH=379 /DNA_ID=CAMNT_0010406283 /DNA_START=76 /DNA_END=1215 /DNA_ORIENTATION=+
MQLLLLCVFLAGVSGLRHAREEEGTLHAKVKVRTTEEHPTQPTEASLVSNEATKRTGRRRKRSPITVNAGKAEPKILDDPLTPVSLEDELLNKTAFSLLESEAWVRASTANESGLSINDTAPSGPSVVAFRAKTEGAATLKPAREQAREIARETEKLQMTSLFDVMSNTYSELPKLNWHTKWAIVLCCVLILLAKGACMCLCIHNCQKRQRELAMKEAARLVCKDGAGFGSVDEAKVAAILGGILQREQPDNGEILDKSKNCRGSSDASDSSKTKGKPYSRDDSQKEPVTPSLATTVPPSVPRGSVSWSMYYSENGVPCFYNPETGEKTWEVPNEIAALATNEKGMADTFQLPSGCTLTDDSDSEWGDDDNDNLSQNSL